MGRVWTEQPVHLCRPFAVITGAQPVLVGARCDDRRAPAASRPFDWQVDAPEVALDLGAGADAYVATDPTGITRRLRVVAR